MDALRFKRGKPRPDGFRSQYEATIAKNLGRAGIEYQYEPVSYKLELAGKQPGTRCDTCGGRRLIKVISYTPDFFIPAMRGYVEAKGRFVASDRRKALAFVAQAPEYKYAMLFMRNNTLSKSSKTRYSDWCTDNGIKFAIGTEVPEEWLK